jgi:hypothetical protein
LVQLIIKTRTILETINTYTDNRKDKVMVWFFAGGETMDDKFNVFTGSFIRLMKQIMDKNFDYIKGIYYRMPMMNVIWALNHAQRPITVNRKKNRFQEVAYRQLISAGLTPDTQLVMVSSSTGSVIAAQTACYLAEKNRENYFLKRPFHLALGASLISKESELFRKLDNYHKEGMIGKFIHDDLQDERDNSSGVGGKTQGEAFANAFGLMLPVFSRKYQGPSFLNTHPVKGHLHRRRSQTVRKALDFINILLVKHNLAGDFYQEKARAVIEQESAH